MTSPATPATPLPAHAPKAGHVLAWVLVGISLLVPQPSIAQESAAVGHAPDDLLRLAQYEQIVGVFVDAHTGFCMDTQLGGKWRLPDAAVNSSPVPANIESPVRQAHDDCLAAVYNDDLRVVGALRLALENQRRVAMANERLALARRCLQQTGVPAARKQCLEHATGDTLTETQWKRWNVLHQLWLRSA